MTRRRLLRSSVCAHLAAAMFLAFAALAVVSCAASKTTTLYVSCRGVDSRAGTAPGAAWRTLGRANRASLRPGDRLLLRRGCEWKGQRLEASWQGTAARPIVIGAYGDRRLQRPLLRDGRNENVLVTGAHLRISALRVSHVATDRTDCGQRIGDYVGFEFTKGAHNITVTRSRASGEMAGARIERSAHHIRLLHSTFAGNGVMQPGTELGAWGVLVDGDDNEVAWNIFRGNRSTCVLSNGRFASNSVELFGASRNRIHHNWSAGDRVFSELGSSSSRTSRGNLYAYNVFASSLPSSRFITTRGAKDTSFGPVLATTLLHNTTYQTASDSQGVVCSKGCSAKVLTMRGNVVWAERKVVYADGPLSATLNIFWNSSGDPFLQLAGQRGGTPLRSNMLLNPRLIDPASGDFVPAANSPALDRDAQRVLYATDAAGTRLPQHGGTDIGALERRIATSK
jgi:hypothetical protein